jgi:hypothetical protein
MTDTPNPYSPPASRVGDVPARKIRVYSPSQGSVGTFLGGPLPGLVFLRANYAAMGEAAKAGSVARWGLLGSLGFLLVVPVIPEWMPRFVIPLAMAWAVRLLIERGQFSKEQIAASGTYDFHSNWRVAGVTLLGALVFLLLAFGVIALYFMWGWIPEE